jgi:hypothetical protein
MKERVKLSGIWEAMERKSPSGAPAVFSIGYVKKSTGCISRIANCICTSIHSKGSTVNIMPEGEQRPKSIRKCLIIEFNESKIYL